MVLFIVRLVIYKYRIRLKYMLTVRLAGDHQYGNLLFSWLSLVMSLMGTSNLLLKLGMYAREYLVYPELILNHYNPRSKFGHLGFGIVKSVNFFFFLKILHL